MCTLRSIRSGNPIGYLLMSQPFGCPKSIATEWWRQCGRRRSGALGATGGGSAGEGGLTSGGVFGLDLVVAGVRAVGGVEDESSGIGVGEWCSVDETVQDRVEVGREAR